MVDGQYAPLHDEIKAAISAISGRPIKYPHQQTYVATIPAGTNRLPKDGVTVVSRK